MRDAGQTLAYIAATLGAGRATIVRALPGWPTNVNESFSM